MQVVETMTARTDGITGELGWLFDSIPHNDELYMASNDPIQIAHDFVEHVNGLKAIGTIHDEFEALGGIIYVRGFDGTLRRDGTGSMYSFGENLAADLVRMYGEFWCADYQPANFNTRAIEDDYIIQEAIQCARRDVPKEYDDVDRAQLNEYLESAKHYMRRGYRKCRDRFKGDRQVANNLFWLIHRTAVDHVREPDWEGQQLKMVVKYPKAPYPEVYFDEYFEEDY